MVLKTLRKEDGLRLENENRHAEEAVRRVNWPRALLLQKWMENMRGPWENSLAESTSCFLPAFVHRRHYLQLPPCSHMKTIISQSRKSVLIVSLASKDPAPSTRSD